MNSLSKCDANYASLTPITFLKRASAFYADRTSIIYEGTRFTWRQTYERCCRLASSLSRLNVVKNTVVSVLAPNVPALYEMHFAVPMAGAILNTINTRLDVSNIALILRHSEAKILFVDYQFIQEAKDALRQLMAASLPLPFVVVIDDIDSPTGARFGELEYEQLVHDGDVGFTPVEVDDEWDSIALNYTSGTTSAPKGVVYSHRGAYLSTLSLVVGWEMGNAPVYLWTLPMFHCNGWTFTWGIAARGGTNVCMRNTTAFDIYRNINLHHVTHMCCAPIVFRIILEANGGERRRFGWLVNVLTGGAPPPAALLEKMEALGFHITHAYGLTEATGPALVCEWQEKWNILPADEQAKLKARQGISILTLADVDVKNLETMDSVPHDGRTTGEIVLRGSSIMKGYFKDPAATAKAFQNGWFLTGDVGVIHPDGYLEIKDRSKDVIISGGENISSVEVETVLYRHPQVAEAAVVAMPHPRWGESPCAFVVVHSDGGKVSEAEMIEFCRKNMSHYMAPKKVVFVAELPKTLTGKIQKFKLREQAKLLVGSEKRVSGGNKSGRHDGGRQPEYGQHVMAMSRL
ncbi:butyrate--CoA ligase AAE11, peroxisomal-like [Cucurbita pepo subsp. pepo]|uniref:butyrate--CoA ligase AAE11, peroxisomal-like n=1 Tax=Cucurbita pepo subsp. pepo TaxID=3664 RepID=UPI000C9D5977|nr:butyrate--CoA ligase AAE11, peroxisomal-like [Cucurbita pepo subsp. pepo]